MSDDRTVEAIYEALDRQAPEEALVLAEQALNSSEEEDPVVRFLAGIALLEMDHAEEAIEQLEKAVAEDPEDAEFRANLALALFRVCRFTDAGKEAEKAVAADPDLPDAHSVLSMVLERSGRLVEADQALERAAKIDPERFPPVIRLSRSAFEEEVGLAAQELPEHFRAHLKDVAVIVEDVPPAEVLFEEDPPLDPELLGLFVGIALKDRSHLGPGGDQPPRILLFQRNLERYATDAEHLREEIAVTLYHELGHYLGLDEDELVQIDLG
jgi:predicted Zn-dependent protease with MMP-like domain/cytochrome c-type biogenesis protein CcmH/NrfG